MDAETLQAIRARADAATPGPWHAEGYYVDSRGGWRGAIARAFDAPQGMEQANANAAFIAHARTDIPALLDEVDRLRKAASVPCRCVACTETLPARNAQVKRLREACQAAKTWIDRFGEHAPVVFGGEAELSEQLRAALEA